MYVEASTWPTSYQSISVIAEILNIDGFGSVQGSNESHYKRGIEETLSLVARESERIKNDAKLKGLIQE